MSDELNDSEYVTVAEARELLGVSRYTMTNLLRDGVLTAESDPLDRRSKLLRRADVLALQQRSRKARSARASAPKVNEAAA